MMYGEGRTRTRKRRKTGRKKDMMLADVNCGRERREKRNSVEVGGNEKKKEEERCDEDTWKEE